MRISLIFLLAFLLVCGAGPAANEPTEVHFDQLFRKLGKELNNRASNPEARLRAALQLQSASDSVRALASYSASALTDPYEPIRLSAVRSLRSIGPSADVAIPDLLRTLQEDQSAKVRAEAADALITISQGMMEIKNGVQNSKMIPALTSVVKNDSDLHVRERACVVLGVLGPEAKAAVPDLIAVLKDKKEPPSLRGWAASSLGRIGLAAQAALPTFFGILNQIDEYREVQHSVFACLPSLGPPEEVVVPVLLAALQDERRVHLRAQAAIGLGYYKAKVAIPALAKALDVSRVGDRETAKSIQLHVLEALGKLGSDARVAIPKIEQIIDDPKSDPILQEAAAAALEKIQGY